MSLGRMNPFEHPPSRKRKMPQDIAPSLAPQVPSSVLSAPVYPPSAEIPLSMEQLAPERLLHTVRQDGLGLHQSNFSGLPDTKIKDVSDYISVLSTLMIPAHSFDELRAEIHKANVALNSSFEKTQEQLRAVWNNEDSSVNRNNQL